VTGSAGRDGCPCIDASSLLNASDGSDCAYFTEMGFRHRQKVAYCYPAASYGSNTCEAHDKDLQPYCGGASPPEFCIQPWCYVDPRVCKSSATDLMHSSEYFARADQNNDVEAQQLFNGRLYFSYTTCGVYEGCEIILHFSVMSSLKDSI
jgi:hypothetical protein